MVGTPLGAGYVSAGVVMVIGTLVGTQCVSTDVVVAIGTPVGAGDVLAGVVVVVGTLVGT